jgi:hypothetical protein
MRMIDERGTSEPEWLAPDAVAAKIDKAVTTIRLEAERRDLGEGMILISAQRLRQIMRLVFLA